MRPTDPVNVRIVVRMPRLIHQCLPLLYKLAWCAFYATVGVVLSKLAHSIIHPPYRPTIVAIDCSGTSSATYLNTPPLGLQQYETLNLTDGVFGGDCLLRGLAVCNDALICQQISNCIDRDHFNHFRNLYPDNPDWIIRRKVPRAEPY